MFVLFKKLFCSKLKKLKIATITKSMSTVQSPLSGIRILDLTRIVAGPYCTMILGDLGADIIKVERPGSGDETRQWGPPYVGNSKETCYFIALNRNKKSVCIDFKAVKGQEIIYDLARKSDVLIENYVPGKLSEFKLDYDQIKAIAPHLIYCSMTGFGPDGPYSKRPGYDVIASSLGGLLHITGPENGEPVKVGVAITDICTGLYAHGAIMAALLQRSKTNLGQKVDVDLLSTQLACLINIGGNYLNAKKEGKRWGTAHESIVPYEAFPTKDGYFTIGVGSDRQFFDLCGKLNLPNVAKDSKYQTNMLRVKNRKELIGVLRSVMKTKTIAEWTRIFEGAEFPCGAVNSLEQTFDDPHVKSINLVKELKHSKAGKVKVVGPPVKYSLGGNLVRLPPPNLGEHTFEILRDVLGYDSSKISDLAVQKIVQ